MMQVLMIKVEKSKGKGVEFIDLNKKRHYTELSGNLQKMMINKEKYFIQIMFL